LVAIENVYIVTYQKQSVIIGIVSER